MRHWQYRNIQIPFRLDFANMAVDDVVSFCVAILLAVLVNAEGQAFVSTLLGDARTDSKDRFHFNAFLHIDIWGTICFFISGFGWAKQLDIRVDKFSHPRLFMIFSRLAGPWANFLMACIAASIVGLMGKFEVQDRVFTIVLIVNLSTAIYQLIPIPPLAGSSLITAFFLDKLRIYEKKIHIIGSLILIAFFLSERLGISKLVTHVVDPMIQKLFSLISG